MGAVRGREGLTRALYEVKTRVAPYPWIALPVARIRSRSGHGEVVRSDSDVVIEGYPRSANQFSVAAFRLAQDRPMKVAHHTHAPGNVIAGLRRHVPALVLVREPQDAVLEFVLARPALTVEQALKGWVRFYEPLLPWRAHLAVGPFSLVTADFGMVVRRVNERFGTAFKEFEHTEENVLECFRQINADWQTRLSPESTDFHRYVGRPSAVRDRWKDDLRSSFEASPAELRSRAASMYDAFAREPSP